MTLNILATFWSVSFLFVITPGVDWAYTISAGTKGKVVVPAVFGLLLGHLIATIVVATGIGALVSSTPLALTVIVIIGALYLVGMGINLIVKPSTPSASKVQNSGSWVKWFTKGTLVSGMNPKVFLLFLALLPQFTDPSTSWPVSVQIITLGLVHILSSGIVYLLVGYSSQAILKSRPLVAQAVSKISGLLMLIIAIFLLNEQIVLWGS